MLSAYGPTLQIRVIQWVSFAGQCIFLCNTFSRLIENYPTGKNINTSFNLRIFSVVSYKIMHNITLKFTVDSLWEGVPGVHVDYMWHNGV